MRNPPAHSAVAPPPKRLYNLPIRYGWNPDKAASNLAKHGVAFEAADGFDWDGATIEPDTRRDYGEARFTARGLIGTRLHVMAFTVRPPVTWVISLRKANRKEVRRYGQG